MQPIPVLVSALFADRLKPDVLRFRPTHTVSLVEDSFIVPEDVVRLAGRHLRLSFADSEARGTRPPSVSQIDSLVAFLQGWLAEARQKEGRLLVHCHLGVSRSPAAAYAALALLGGDGLEFEAFQILLRITNKPWPNRDVVAMVDDALQKEGRLLAPLDAYREQHSRRLDAYRRLNRLRL